MHNTDHYCRETWPLQTLSGGEDGYLFRGAPILLLTTRGRKSGQLRRTALIFGRDGANYLIVASKGGAPAMTYM